MHLPPWNSQLKHLARLLQVLGAAMAVGFWTACYQIQPSSTILRPLARRASANALARKSYNSAVVSASKTMRRLPVLQRLGDPSRLTASLAESICVRAGIKPATFPFKVRSHTMAHKFKILGIILADSYGRLLLLLSPYCACCHVPFSCMQIWASYQFVKVSPSRI